MLAEEVHLRDWNISVFGKAEAIRETVKNFAEAESIEIHILALYEGTDTVAGELAKAHQLKISPGPESMSQLEAKTACLSGCFWIM